MLGCIWHAMHLPLIVGADHSSEVRICIDGPHASHVDGKGHSGMFSAMVRGSMMNTSHKLGVASMISTETEVVSNGK